MLSLSRPSSALRLQSISSRAASHWANLKLAPPDKIMGLNEAFKSDTRSNKINLGVGAYRDDKGKPFTLPSVRRALADLEKQDLDHEYSSISGVQSYIDKSIEFAYGKDSPAIAAGRVAAIQTLSGTGACRITGEFIATFFGRGKKLYLPSPTWPNHNAIMKNAGLDPVHYRYYNKQTNRLDFDGLLADVSAADSGSAFLFHPCAHNPTGCDPSHEQWNILSKALLDKNHIVFMDMAYQGFSSGDAEADAFAVRKFVSDGHNIILGQSFAKNFGLYGERIGTLSIVTDSKEESERVLSQLKLIARPMYSNPPIYGARIVAHILSNEELRKQWTSDCKAMADRIGAMRVALRTKLTELTKKDWAHVTSQIGMFCFSGLNAQQVARLREDFGIYCTEDGRFSMAGINSSNVDYLAKAVAEVTK